MLGKLIATISYWILVAFFVAMLARLVFDYIRIFKRNWRPKGFVLVIAEATYTVTDPPLKLLRKVLPPVRIGNIGIDVAYSIVLFIVLILMSITRSYMV